MKTFDPAYKFDLAVGAYRGFISPIISIVGICGNVLVIIIFSREIKISRFSIYCISLAVSHSIALFMNSFLDDFLGRGIAYISKQSHLMTKLDILSDTSCKVMEYVPNSMYFISSSLLILFSLDRLLTIYHPIRFFSAYYINFACAAAGVCFVMGLVINIPLLISYGLQKDEYNSLKGWMYKCESLVHNNGTWVLANFGLYNKVIGAFIVPTFVVLILNCVICYKMWIFYRNRNYLINHKHCINKTSNSNSNKGGLVGARKNSTGIFFSSTQTKENEFSRIFGHIALNTTFLFLNMPLVILMILRFHVYSSMKIDNDNKENLYYINSIKHLSRLFSSVKDISYAVNFFVYVKFLPNFYVGLINLLECCCVCLKSTDKKSIMSIKNGRGELPKNVVVVNDRNKKSSAVNSKTTNKIDNRESANSNNILKQPYRTTKKPNLCTITSRSVN